MNIFEIFANQITIVGHGYAEMVSFIVQMATYGLRKGHVESIIQDYNNTKEEGEKKDEAAMDAPMDAAMEAPMEMEAMM
jgi:hypothetical protein